ncbi:hypothetical protein HW115_07290 [Verrucomicrobiaceae bacterium N1E253]|uniref:Uncharacterized protein n=1 Tax=Oceaniferula marina TaxID=2748318 RepID=A0A851GL05_9BACT|nr:hypothetical protein [Oceaniferula marina]NWK55410.1 hypothetical protein [Oceaniferula marina]
MDQVIFVLSQPFTWGLVLGLFFMVMTWRLMHKDVVMLRSDNKRLVEENRELQSHLSTQLKINAKGNEQLEKELNGLKEQNENLRVNLNAAQQKPGRAERRQLEILETAASAMREQAPGFAPAWEKAVRDAELSQKEAEGGLKKLMRRVIPNRKTAPVLSIEDSDVRDVESSATVEEKQD